MVKYSDLDKPLTTNLITLTWIPGSTEITAEAQYSVESRVTLDISYRSSSSMYNLSGYITINIGQRSSTANLTYAVSDLLSATPSPSSDYTYNYTVQIEEGEVPISSYEINVQLATGFHTGFEYDDSDYIDPAMIFTNGDTAYLGTVIKAAYTMTQTVTFKANTTESPIFAGLQIGFSDTLANQVNNTNQIRSAAIIYGRNSQLEDLIPTSKDYTHKILEPVNPITFDDDILNNPLTITWDYWSD